MKLSEATDRDVQGKPSALVGAWMQQMKAHGVKTTSVKGEAVTAAFVRGALEVAMLANPEVWTNERVSIIQFLCACGRSEEAMRVIENNVKC